MTVMGIWELSLSGGVLVLAVVLLRALALDRLPKATFLALWLVAAARLLLPFSVPSPLSVYSLAERVPAALSASSLAERIPGVLGAFSPAEWIPGVLGAFSPAEWIPGALGVPSPAQTPPAAQGLPEAPALTAPGAAETIPAGAAASPAVPADAGAADGQRSAGEGRGLPLREAIRLAGAAAWGAFFLVSYLRCRRQYRTALPVEVPGWTARGRLRRRVEVRQSDQVSAPLTYGVLRPVILLPKGMDRSGGERLGYVLEHELVHIRHFDSLIKLVLAAAACVHWFNPLVWVMLELANRDIELRCDEAVVTRLGRDSRAAYAMALIAMEERKSGLGPFASAFSKNAIEERIRAIMKMKKRSLAAVLAAVILVCGLSVAFVTSAAERQSRPTPRVEEGSFTRAELAELTALWLEGWEDMTVADYQQALWRQNDTPAHYDLLDRYGQSRAEVGYYNDPEATEEANAFDDYFRYVYEPLTGEGWQQQFFFGAQAARDETGGAVLLEYSYALEVLDRNSLTAGAYRQVHRDIEAGIQAIVRSCAAGEVAEGTQAYASAFARLSEELSTGSLSVTTVDGSVLVRSFGKSEGGTGGEDLDRGNLDGEDLDEALHRQFSQQSKAEWDRLLSPYVPFGLTYTFDDPDLDGNGLTMWFEGREVRGIVDEQEGIWITEHMGPGFGEGAVELYTVYEGGRLTGLRLATPEEQASWDASRRSAASQAPDPLPAGEETREFPRASREDYDALMTLRTQGYELSSLEDFNRRLLDWANDHSGAWDRINCDVLWDDFGVRLTEAERAFASVTCRLSGTENGQMVRALHTGGPEEDPRLSASLPDRQAEEAGIVTAWCELYYDISYHVPDRSAVSVAERDRCVSGMLEEIGRFWQETDLDTLLGMAEEDVVALFNRWGGENSTAGLVFNPVTAEDIHLQSVDERSRD